MTMAKSPFETPSIDIQKEETERLLATPLINNEKWYLVQSEWFRNFKAYIGLDKNCDTDNEPEHPGPIDNSSLYKDGDPTDIRDNLLEEVDYVFVPQELWRLLRRWYGLMGDQHPLSRMVVEFGRVLKNRRIEVYPVSLHLMKDFDSDNTIVQKFSKTNTIGHVGAVMRKLFKIPEDVDIKLWRLFPREELDFNKTIVELDLINEQVIVVETCQSDGTWISPPKNTIHANSLKNSLDKTASLSMPGRSTAGPSNSRVTRFNSLYSSNNDIQCGNVTPGLCGLCNIMGTTCFMNSVIQCLSNCPPLVKHFAEDEYLKDLNTENPIGMKGKIATAFGELIKIMWSGKFTFTVPSNFKEQVGIFAPQFSGYQQQDAQELLTFLLDGLHEDLNKIRQKPYIQISDSNGRPDEIVASEAWDIYQKRNDSIIVDYFHGLLKSTVVCPDCAKVSVTFDPFCHLSVPLPIRRERNVEVTFIPADITKKPQVIITMVPKKGQISDLFFLLGQQCGVSPDELVATHVKKHHFHKFYSSHDALENIYSMEGITVYEVPRSETHVPVPVVLWEVNTSQDFNFSQLFGFPMIIMLPQNNCTYSDIYQAILLKVYRYLKVPNHGECICNQKEGAASTSACRCQTPESILSSLPADLFVLHVVNPSTSVVFRLHNDSNPIQMPISGKGQDIGRQYLAAQWTTENRKLYLNSLITKEIDRDEAIRQMLSQRRSYKVQLKDCLELFTMCEKLGADDAWYCPDCKQHQRATKKFDLWKLPKILIIHLKRFSNTRFRRDKIDSLVEFPLKDLDMSKYITNDKHPPAKYNLLGVCNHFGCMGSGHYTAYSLNKIDKHWYVFDDHNVSSLSEESVVTNAAYVLFYIRSDLQMV